MIKEGFDFFKKAKQGKMGEGGRVSRNGAVLYYIEVSLDIPHEAA